MSTIVHVVSQRNSQMDGHSECITKTNSTNTMLPLFSLAYVSTMTLSCAVRSVSAVCQTRIWRTLWRSNSEVFKTYNQEKALSELLQQCLLKVWSLGLKLCKTSATRFRTKTLLTHGRKETFCGPRCVLRVTTVSQKNLRSVETVMCPWELPRTGRSSDEVF